MDVMTEENVDLDRKKKTETEKLNQTGAEGATFNYLINKMPLPNFFWKSAKLSCSSEVTLINVQGGVNVNMKYEINVQGCFELLCFEVENQVRFKVLKITQTQLD